MRPFYRSIKRISSFLKFQKCFEFRCFIELFLEMEMSTWRSEVVKWSAATVQTDESADRPLAVCHWQLRNFPRFPFQIHEIWLKFNLFLLF